MNLTEKQIKSEYKYEGKIIKLRKDVALLPNGKQADREVIEHPGGVCVAALTTDNELLMVNQYRYPYSEVISEIPAGKRDKYDESPLECGIRELKEETGATAEKYINLGTLYPSPGYTNEVIYMYAATCLTYGEQDPDDDEFLSVEKVPLDKLIDKIISGEIKDSKTQIAILKLKYLIDNKQL